MWSHRDITNDNILHIYGDYSAYLSAILNFVITHQSKQNKVQTPVIWHGKTTFGRMVYDIGFKVIGETWVFEPEWTCSANPSLQALIETLALGHSIAVLYKLSVNKFA